NLSDALWRLRQACEPEAAADGAPPPLSVLCYEGDTVRFNPDADVWFDVRDFETLLANPDDVAAQERAVDLYRGELLFGDYDDWILLERERLRQLYLAALNRLIPAHKARGAWEAATLAAARLVQTDPYQEEATRELMRLYYRQQRRDKALQQYTVLKAILEA